MTLSFAKQLKRYSRNCSIKAFVRISVGKCREEYNGARAQNAKPRVSEVDLYFLHSFGFLRQFPEKGD